MNDDTGQFIGTVRGVDELAMLRAYFERRRDALIAELRELDRLLGRPQTIPPRRR